MSSTKIFSLVNHRRSQHHQEYYDKPSFKKHHLFSKASLLILSLTSISLLTSEIEAARTRLRNTLDVKFNWGCDLPQCNSSDQQKSAVNLFQVVSSNSGSPDKTNFIYSNINGPPMVITTSSSQESNLLIDWNLLLNSNSTNSDKKDENHQQPTNGFHFNVTQDGAIGVLIEKIIFFDDNDQTGLFTREKPFFEVEWSDIIWDLATLATYQKDDFLKTQFRIRPEHRYSNGNFSIRVGIPRDHKADRQKEVPHLKLNNQSILIVVNIDGIQPPPNYQNARLAMSFIVVVQTPDGQVSLDTVSDPLISDEYTPGVFRIKSLQFKSKSKPQSSSSVSSESSALDQIPESFSTLDGQLESLPVNQPFRKSSLTNSDKLGFLYWKEVAYTDRRKIISRTIDVFDTETPISMETLPNVSQPFYQYFKYKPSRGPIPLYRAYRFDLIFGKENASYSSTNFTDFSFVLGLGAAPQELMFSFLVKIIIFVCFCLPIIVMLGGLVYLTLRRLGRYGDTELLLAAES